MSAGALREVQGAAGAVFISEGAQEAPLHYGDVGAEYKAVREGVGIVDRSKRGKVRATGSDRLRFIAGMVTNRVEGLEAGAGNHASLTDAQGHTLLDLWVHHREAFLMLETDPGLQERLYTSLDKYLIADDVELIDVTDEWAILGIQGPGSGDLLARAIGESGKGLAEHHHRKVDADGIEAILTARSYTGESGFDLWVDVDKGQAFWETLIQAGGQPVGTEALKLLRVEAGLPRYGKDVDERVTPLEAGLWDTVDFEKGCYIGQETIAKMHYRGKPRRYLVGLHVNGEQIPEEGDMVQVEGKDIGYVTSSIHSPSLGQVIALASFRRGFEELGQRVVLGSGGNAQVVALPFYRSHR